MSDEVVVNPLHEAGKQARASLPTLLTAAGVGGMAANRFDCPDCGVGVGVDEDGCCRTCGADAAVILAADPAPSVIPQEGLPEDSVVQEARELLAHITPPPWAWEWVAEKSNEWAVGQAFREDGSAIEGELPKGEWLEDAIIERRLVGLNESGHARAADAKFISAAPRLVHQLLAEVERLQAAPPVSGQLERLREQVATLEQERLVLARRAKAWTLEDTVKHAQENESDHVRALRLFQIIAALRVQLATADAQLAALSEQQRRYENAQCITCAQDLDAHPSAALPDAPMRQLIETWRKKAKRMEADAEDAQRDANVSIVHPYAWEASRLNDCANELEALLTVSEQP